MNYDTVNRALGISDEREKQLFMQLVDMLLSGNYQCRSDVILEIIHMYEKGKINLYEMALMQWFYGVIIASEDVRSYFIVFGNE